MRSLNKIAFSGAGVALTAGVLVLRGCNGRSLNSEPAAPTVAVAAPRVTPTPKPSPTPTPKPRGSGIAFYKIETKQRVFALTFDDGPDPTYTPKVLKILAQKKAPATFFMVGQMVQWHGSTAKKVRAAGFPIGAHSWTHPMRTKNPVMEIERTNAIIERTLGVTPILFRPPYGILKNGLAREASKRGQDVILWSSEAADWNKKNSSAQLKANVLKNLAPGGIALMHDGGGDRAKTVAALPGLIDAVRNRGYKLVTVPQLMKMGAPKKAVIGGATHSPGAKKHAAKKAQQTKTPPQASAKTAVAAH